MQRNRATPPPGGVFPLCFASKADYEGWYEWAWKEHHKNPGPNAHCEDCTPEYQARMKVEGRCENPTHPLGIFE
jgi:hypothetical protein